MIKNTIYWTCDLCKHTVENNTSPDRWMKIKLDLVGFSGGAEYEFLVCDSCCPVPVKSTAFRKMFDKFYLLRTTLSTKLLRR